MDISTAKNNTKANDQLLEYTRTVQSLQRSLHRIIANKKAICASLSRTASALRSISTGSSAAGPAQPL